MNHRNPLVFFLCLLTLILSLPAQQQKPLPIETVMKGLAAPAVWQKMQAQRYPQVTKEGLEKAVELARVYLLNHQKPEGNFVYSLDLRTGRTRVKDNQVRQAGALWALALLNRERHTTETLEALWRGVEFFSKQEKLLQNGARCPVYPGSDTVRTGAIAVYSLALMDLLESPEGTLKPEQAARAKELLDRALQFLQSMEIANGSWAEEYLVESGMRAPDASPYFDGECLLAYCRAARRHQYTELLPRIQQALPLLVQQYTVDAWKPGANHELTKGFYQWSCMAFAEYSDARWPEHAELVQNAALTLSWWILYENDLLHRGGNTGYALEGLVPAWRLAKKSGNEMAAKELREAIFQVMNRLAPLQFMGPYMRYNSELSALRKAPVQAEGAITSSEDDLEVRIDTVQHQTHGMLLMLKYMF